MIELVIYFLIFSGLSIVSYLQGRNAQPASEDPSLMRLNFYILSVGLAVVGVIALVKLINKLVE